MRSLPSQYTIRFPACNISKSWGWGILGGLCPPKIPHPQLFEMLSRLDIMGSYMMGSVAFFVSPHGFGHAARSSAVMLALRARQPGLDFEIFTRVPEWFFRETLGDRVRYHNVLTDVGMAQRTPLEEDLEETLRRLQAFVPFSEELLDGLAAELKALGCSLVVSDISPLGLAAARRAGLPAVLLENFTWDWIYAGYLGELPGLARPMEYMQQVFAQADYHIQAEPVCNRQPGVDLVVPPISRPPRLLSPTLRQQMKVPPGRQVVLITMGGIEGEVAISTRLEQAEELFFIIPGGAAEVQWRSNQLLLPHQSGFYHPDLVHASDGVIGKPGYSTLAEAYAAGVPFAYLPRPRFREYPLLAEYIDRELGGLAISIESFEQGDWVDPLYHLIKTQPRRPREANGAAQAADFMLQVLRYSPSSSLQR